MLTKNFFNWMMATISGIDIANGFVAPNGTTYNAIRATGSSANTYLCEYMDKLAMQPVPETYNVVGVRIGTGVTPATADDYTLESCITSGLSVVNPSDVTVTKENNFLAMYATYTVTNNGTTAVAISEIGLFGAGNYSGSSKTPILVERTVLENPIVINPGEAKPITYTIRFNYPTE